MKGTRRFWAIAGVVTTLATLAVVFARPVLLYGAASIGALLLAQQYRFLRSLQTTDAALAVEQSVTSQYVKKDEESYATLAARLAQPSALELTVAAGVPTAASVPAGTDQTITVEPGDISAETTLPVTWPVVGRVGFSQPTVTATDQFGLFSETLERGPAPSVVVEPRVPRRVHVGKGGEQVTGTFGGHRSDQLGAGLDPAEIRQYVPGDSVSNIDWKATARLDYPHVRDYEVETDRETLLFVDHRDAMAVGPQGETKLDYLREVALAFVESARDITDPLGLATFDDDGLTTWEQPSTQPGQYGSVRTALHDLAVSTGNGNGSARATRSPAVARRKATLLAGDDSAYSQRVTPFFSEAEGYVQRMDDDPLFDTVRLQLGRVSGAVWPVIFTDDTDRTQLRETVKLARQQSAGVLVFVTPSVLFERGGLADLDDAYSEYVDFEEFRRELARLDGVHAFEVGPGDRVEAVLATGRERRSP